MKQLTARYYLMNRLANYTGRYSFEMQLDFRPFDFVALLDISIEGVDSYGE